MQASKKILSARWPQKRGLGIFSNDHTTCVASSGYADDMIIYAESWRGIWAMHEWVREFCRAHYFKINSDKCRYIISDWRNNDPRWLYSVDGKNAIIPKGPDTVFRYLGIWISMSLDWQKQI